MSDLFVTQGPATEDSQDAIMQSLVFAAELSR